MDFCSAYFSTKTLTNNDKASSNTESDNIMQKNQPEIDSHAKILGNVFRLGLLIAMIRATLIAIYTVLVFWTVGSASASSTGLGEEIVSLVATFVVTLLIELACAMVYVAGSVGLLAGLLFVFRWGAKLVKGTKQ